MNIVFCADRKVLPGLHVAAYSLLSRINPSIKETRFSIFSDRLDEADLALLRRTLASLDRPFTLELCQVDASVFSGFPPLNGSWATYYRLAVPKVLDVERFLYVDADTLCDVDVSELNKMEMGISPAGLVAEAPMADAADRFVATYMGNRPGAPYFNAGVILVNVAEWRRQQITEKAMEFIATHRPPFHDQSALNVILHGKAVHLEERFNSIANMRKHWPDLRRAPGTTGRLIHFLDYPKPWDFLAEWVHPQYQLWRSMLNQTALAGFSSWQQGPSRVFPQTRKARNAYLKAFKDRLLFGGYRRGWLKKIKGLNSFHEI
jgi:lipopolysaccharide biosynthesis glycosyltransferase